jgi:diguanylate cyclase (GGDEF)-like protein/PAS domain S-box-containing protein
MTARIKVDVDPFPFSAAGEMIAKVLVVDDNPLDRLRAGRLVDQDPRCRAIYAENCTEALQRMAEHQISIVLTDLQMDGMDGLDLVRSVRREHPRVPVILMTGYGSEDAAMEALRVGATDYVPKQKLARELLPVLVRALRAARAGSRRLQCLRTLVHRELHFELGCDPDLLPPLLEFLNEEMSRLELCDSAELMRTTIALDEALRNALYHGNLEVSSDLREGNERAFHDLARERATLPPFQDRRVRVVISHDSDQSRFVIRDDGPGFDTSGVDRPLEPEDLLRASGRGILLMKAFMDSVTFNRAGNEVTLVKRRHGESRLPIAPFPNPIVGTIGGPGANGQTTAHRAPPAGYSRDLIPAEPGHVDATDFEGPDGQEPLEFDDYKRLLDQLHEAVCFVDSQRRIVYWNAAAEGLTGYTASAVFGRLCCDVLEHQLDPSIRHRAAEECPIALSLRRDGPIHERLFLRHQDGRQLSIDARIAPVRDDRGVVIGVVEVLCDATSSLVAEGAFRQIREAADRDPLTGLANRRCLDRTLFHYLEQAQQSGLPLSIIISDLDHFKQINDQWGHVIGDQALVQFATTLQNQSRSIDLVARFGGEEFIVLLPGRPLESAVQIAERHRNNTSSATPQELGARWLTASFGVAQAAPGESASELLKRADAALYRAKSLGRNRVEVDPS